MHRHHHHNPAQLRMLGGPFRRRRGRRWPDPDASLSDLEAVQRDLEQAAADVAERIRRLRAATDRT